MVVHAVMPESVNSNVLMQAESQSSSSNVPFGFQQTPESYRPHKSQYLSSLTQPVLQMSPEEARPIGTASNFVSLPQINVPVSNASATSALVAAATAANPFLLAALVGMQQNPASTPLPPNLQAFVSLLPYLQQFQNTSQGEYLMQEFLALQHMAVVQQLTAASQAAIPSQQQQQAPQNWLSPPPSSASGSENDSSPILSTSDESLSVLSASSHVSPRPQGDAVTPDRDASAMISEDEYLIEALIEARKGLSEKESIAVAVLAGMAGYQR